MSRQNVVTGFVIPVRRNKSNNQFINEFTYINRNLLEAQYKRERSMRTSLGEEAVSSFDRVYPNLYNYVRKQFDNKYISVKDLIGQIKFRFASYVEAHKEHIKNLIEDSGLYEDLLLKINEEFNPDRVSYLGDNIYQYVTTKGELITFRFRDYSPTILEFIED